MSKKRYAMRQPRFAGGIRLQEARGAVPRAWWAKRWIDTVACKDLAGRYARGRVYAMNGQVTKIEIAPALVKATVVGARTEPYSVNIRFRSPEGEARKRIIARFRDNPILVSRILSGELPTEVERFFRDEALDLFPGGRLADGVYDVTTSCSCPDYGNPCKHSFAVLLLLGEELARRPELLLELRGITIEELCGEDRV